MVLGVVYFDGGGLVRGRQVHEWNPERSSSNRVHGAAIGCLFVGSYDVSLMRGIWLAKYVITI